MKEIIHKCNFIKVKVFENINKIYLKKNIGEYKTNEIYNIISEKLYLDKSQFFLKNSTKIIPYNNNLFIDNICILNDDKNILIELHIRIKGGLNIGGVMDGIANKIADVFEPVAKPVIAIGDFFKMVGKAILFIVKMAIWTIRVFIWVAIEFLNPIKIFTDLFGSVTRITKLIIISIIDIIIALFKYFLNNIFGFIFDGNLYGWDQNTYDKEKKIKKQKQKMSKQYFKNMKNNKDNFTDTNDDNDDDNEYNDNDDNNNDDNNEKCYETPPGQIPFTIIIMTVLCPPLGIFMQYGLSFWINIILCALLSLIFYFPGLIYALILLYC